MRWCRIQQPLLLYLLLDEFPQTKNDYSGLIDTRFINVQP